MKPSIINNRPAFLLAALTALLLFGVAELYVRAETGSSSLSSWPEERFLAHERDDHGKLMSANFNPASESQPGSDSVIYLIGGSTLREGLLTDAQIHDQLAEQDALSDVPTISTHYSFDQSLAETARIALNLPISAGDTVVLNINPRRMGFAPDSFLTEDDRSRISLVPEEPLQSIAETVSGYTDRIGWGGVVEPFGPNTYSPWNDLAIFEHRLFARNWVSGRLSTATTSSWSSLVALDLGDVGWGALFDLSPRDLRRPVRYAYGTEPLSAIEKASIAQTVADERVGQYLDNRDFGFDLLGGLIEQLQQKDASVVLLQLPRAQSSTEAYGPVWPDYDKSVAALVAEREIEHVDLRSEIFAEDDFFDLEHLLAPHRERLTSAVFDQLLEEIG